MAAAYHEQLLDKFYKGVMKEVLCGVGKSHGGLVMRDLGKIWLGFMAESKALELALELVEQQPASASNATTALRMVTIQIKRSPEYGPGSIPMVVSHTLKRGKSHDQLVKVLESQKLKDALTLPVELATKVVQQLVDTALNSGSEPGIPQLDGQDDDSTDEDYDVEEDDDVVEPGDEDQDQAADDDGSEVDSDDNVSFDLDENEGDWPALLETDNVVICQWTKIDKQGKNWVFKLENGVMHVNGRDFVFQKADGSAQW